MEYELLSEESREDVRREIAKLPMEGEVDFVNGTSVICEDANKLYTVSTLKDTYVDVSLDDAVDIVMRNEC